MKLSNRLTHKLQALWRWNAAVGKRNEAAVVRALGQVSRYFNSLCTPFAAYAQSWGETIEDALWLPVSIHWFFGTTALVAYHYLTDGIPLPDDPLAANLMFCICSFLSVWGSKVVMILLPQPFAWFAHRFEPFVDELVVLGL